MLQECQFWVIDLNIVSYIYIWRVSSQRPPTLNSPIKDLKNENCFRFTLFYISYFGCRSIIWNSHILEVFPTLSFWLSQTWQIGSHDQWKWSVIIWQGRRQNSKQTKTNVNLVNCHHARISALYASRHSLETAANYNFLLWKFQKYHK